MDRESVEKLADKAGLGVRSKAKLVRAGEELAQSDGSSTSGRTKGHGAPCENTRPLVKF